MTNNTIRAVLLFISYIVFMLTTKQDINESERKIQYLSWSIAASQFQINRASEENDSRWFKINQTIWEIKEENEKQGRYIDWLIDEIDVSNATSEIIETKECWTWDMVPVLLRYIMWSSNQPLPKWYRLYQWDSTIGTVKVMEKDWMVWKIICYNRSEIVTDDR